MLMCFDSKLPFHEIRKRFGHRYEIETVSSMGETGTRRTITVYLMQQRPPDA